MNLRVAKPDDVPALRTLIDVSARALSTDFYGLYAACAAAAQAAGFRCFELMATLPGEPFYASLGFTVVERVITTLPGGVDVPFSRMSRNL